MGTLLLLLTLSASSPSVEPLARFGGGAGPAIGSAAAGVALGSVVGFSAAYLTGVAGNRDFVAFVATGLVVGGVVGAATTWLLLSSWQGPSWPTWVAPTTAATAIIGTVVGIGGGALFTLFVLIDDDVWGTEIIVPPLIGAAAGFVVGALVPTGVASFAPPEVPE